VLSGRLVRLEPLANLHAGDLAIAAGEDRRAYEFAWVPRPSQIEEYLDSVLQRSESGKFTPFAQIRLSDERAVGCTAYSDPRAWPGRSDLCAVEVGFTWLGATSQRTGINVEAKLLLFEFAFEQLGVAESTSRRMPATSGPAGRSKVLVPASRVCCGVGPSRGRQEKRADCGTRRCTRSSIRNGRLAKPIFGSDWASWEATGSPDIFDFRIPLLGPGIWDAFSGPPGQKDSLLPFTARLLLPKPHR